MNTEETRLYFETWRRLGDASLRKEASRPIGWETTAELFNEMLTFAQKHGVCQLLAVASDAIAVLKEHARMEVRSAANITSAKVDLDLDIVELYAVAHYETRAALNRINNYISELAPRETEI